MHANRLTLIAAIIAAAVGLAPALAAADPSKCEPDKLAEKYPSLAGKTIKVGGDPQTPPYVARDTADFNKVVGFDADLADAVFKCHGIKYEWFLGGWSGILPAVVAGQADVFWDNLYYTPERAKQADFVLYMQAAQGGLVQSGNPKKINSLDDICGAAVGIGVGTVEEQMVRKKNDECKASGKAEINILTYPDVAAGMRLISDKRGDLIILDLTIVDGQAKKDPANFARGFMMLSGFNIGTGVKNGADDLNKAIFEGMTIMQANGTQAGLMTKYGLDPATIVPAEIKKD